MSNSTIISGAESFFIPGNHTGILICHGFNGSPQSIAYIGECFAKAGFTVYAPLLKGHGTCAEDMETCCYQDWIQNIHDAYNTLKKTCSNIVVMGQSMGGALALTLAETEACSGIITLNAALEVPWYETFKHADAPRFILEGKPDIHDPAAYEITYPSVPLKAVQQLLLLMQNLRQKLHHVSCPVLICSSPDDHVVPSYCSIEIFKSIASTEKERIDLPSSYHVASLDYDKDKIVEASLSFIERHVHKKMAS